MFVPHYENLKFYWRLQPEKKIEKKFSFWEEDWALSYDSMKV